MSYNATNKSEEHRAKISAANKGRKNTWAHKICKPMMTPNGLYPSLTAVFKASGVSSRTTIYRWMKKWPEHYYYVN